MEEISITTENIPAELRALPQWVARRGKMPFNPRTGEMAKAGDPSTWGSFEAALSAKGYDGIGFEFHNNGIVGIDLDHVVNPKTGEIADWALQVVIDLDSYTEYSPSGTGLHVFVKGDIPSNGRKKVVDKETGQAIELYKAKRYFTVTGNAAHLAGVITERPEAVKVLYDRLFPPEIKPPCRTEAPEYLKVGLEKDNTLRALWNGERRTGDESANDLALMNKLAYWCNRDIERMAEAFRSSPFTAQKDKAHRKKLEREDYIYRTAQKAAADCLGTAEEDNEDFRRERAKRAFSSASSESVEPDDYSDAGNAEVFARVFKDKLLYADSLGWLKWDGKKWDKSDHHATQCALELSEAMRKDALLKHEAALHLQAQAKANMAAEEAGEEEIERANKAVAAAREYLKHAKATRNAVRIKSMISLSIPYFLTKADRFDADPFDLNTPDGIVDLRTGRIRPHDPLAYCSQITACPPGTEGVEMWDSFLDQVTAGDQGMKNFLQLVAGMAAIGSVFREGIIIAYGGGRNGKSTTINSIGTVFGDYSGGIEVKTLTTDRQNKGASLALLRGKRLIVTGELEENQRLSVSTLKQLASTDGLVIEEKYRSPELIRQSHTLVLFTNHLPRVGSTDGGTWRRLTVVPFNATIQPDEDIPNYTEHLTSNAGGAILSWVIEGAVLFCKQGFKIPVPDSVAIATEEYQAREDWLNNFISECCVKGPNERVQSSALYQAYKVWSESTGDYTRRQNDFVAALEAAGYQKFNLSGVKYWRGMGLENPPISKYSNPYFAG